MENILYLYQSVKQEKYMRWWDKTSLRNFNFILLWRKGNFRPEKNNSIISKVKLCWPETRKKIEKDLISSFYPGGKSLNTVIKKHDLNKGTPSINNCSTTQSPHS
jgi:hypothetical protein